MKTILIGFSAAHTSSDTKAVKEVSATIARKYLIAVENSMVSVPCIGIRPAGRPFLFIIGPDRAEARDGEWRVRLLTYRDLQDARAGNIAILARRM
jgi:hypothetical protein